MNRVPNRQAICDVLLEAAEYDEDIVVLCSDSRGSASLSEFAGTYPQQFVETGIAEQNLVAIAAGLASCGKKCYAAAPACFISTRSYEQCKVDVAYSNTNVKLIGISGGISYGALGMTHHSVQDIAAMSAVPNMRVYLPSDRCLTAWLIGELLKDDRPAYIRVGRNPVTDIYADGNHGFKMNRAVCLREGSDILIVSCGELVTPALAAARELAAAGIEAAVLDMYCVKPIDAEAILYFAARVQAVLTVEEHSQFGGMGSMVSQIVAADCPVKVRNLSLPDEPVVAGTSQEVFDYYGLNTDGIVAAAKNLL